MIKTINRITHPHCTMLLNGERLNPCLYYQKQGTKVTLITHILYPMKIIARSKRQEIKNKRQKVGMIEMKLPIFSAFLNLCI